MNSSFLFTLTRIFVFFHFSVCLRRPAPGFILDSTVFVAFAGEDLTIGAYVTKGANQSVDLVTCSDPFTKQIYHANVGATRGHLLMTHVTVKLKNLTVSGEYVCHYQNIRVFWFLRVRDRGYREPRRLDNRGLIPVAVITVVLLLFSVAGSVYVFRGNWKEQITKCGKTSGKQTQNREERTSRATEGDAEVVKAPSGSFYCSLQARPRSIYDVLEHSAADKEQDQRKTEPPNMVQQTAQSKDEDVFESVYENF